ncbi:MAG: hypothetical protein EOP04_00655 [Proteobacteria bacterium]|nr:MAG: hypothetical protein EOP04_00655 [Pseudomonadota bacterium]
MRKFSGFLSMATSFSILAGCEKSEVVQNVNWYKANKKERLEVLAKCKNNPGELLSTPNCVNANRAASDVTWGAKRGIEIKPLTFERAAKK